MQSRMSDYVAKFLSRCKSFAPCADLSLQDTAGITQHKHKIFDKRFKIYA